MSETNKVYPDWMPKESKENEMKTLELTQFEEESLLRALQPLLTERSAQEANHDVGEKIIARNDALRKILKKLVVDLGKSDQYRATDWLAFGIVDAMSDASLQDLINLEGKDGMTRIIREKAEYFAQKQKRS